MKKVYFMAFAATVAMAMTSCSSEDLTAGTGTSNNEATAINFSTYLGRNVESRASITSGGVENFGVFAFYTQNTAWASATKTAPNFMNNQEVKGTQSESTWSYSYTPVKYWPNNTGDKVSFFAYSPYDANQAWGAGEGKVGTVKYVVKGNGDVTKQEDLLVCKTSDKTVDKTKPTTTENVIFNFSHAMARIGLQVAYAKDALAQGNDKINESETTISITSVKIGDKSFYPQGYLSLVSDAVTWEGEGNKTDYTLNTSNFTNVANKVTNEYQQLNKDDSYLMVIPKDASDFNVTITYVVTTKDTNLNGGESAITNTITNRATVTLEAGKAYTLKLLLGMTSVKVNAEVDSWGDDTETDVKLPENNTASN